MKKFIGLVLLFVSSSCFASGYTIWTKPTMLEYVNQGILVSGNFADVNQCGKSGYIFIRPTPNNPEIFRTMASMILTAFTAQKEVRFYVYECATVSSHWSGNVINAADYGVFYIR